MNKIPYFFSSLRVFNTQGGQASLLCVCVCVGASVRARVRARA